MPVTIGDGLAFCGRPLTEAELALIRDITREFANLAWTELAATLCELLEWRRPNGGLKSRECYLFLRELHRRGWLPWLTTPQPRAHRTPLAKLTASPAPSYDLTRFSNFPTYPRQWGGSRGRPSRPASGVCTFLRSAAKISLDFLRTFR